ncbi:MAG: hypothetical protein AB2541_02990, partial [Candidatus Thiodiazotropha sp.]
KGSSEQLEMANQDPSQSTPGSHIIIPPSEMEKLSVMLKDTFKDEIISIVDSVVQGVLAGLNEKITSLEVQNSCLQDKNKALEDQNKMLISRVAALELTTDQAEQYSRRNNLRVSGIREVDSESTDDIVLKLAADIDCDLQLSDIDRSHRVGKPGLNRSKPRDIIVKFVSYRSRQKLYKLRSALKDRGYRGTFLNEDLTRHRSKVLYESRKAVKDGLAKGSWSSDGTILIKDFRDTVHRVYSVEDLARINFPPKPPEPMQ